MNFTGGIAGIHIAGITISDMRPSHFGPWSSGFLDVLAGVNVTNSAHSGGRAFIHIFTGP